MVLAPFKPDKHQKLTIMKLFKENDNIIVLDDKGVVVLIQNIHDIKTVEESRHDKLVASIQKLDSESLLDRYVEIVEYFCLLDDKEVADPRIKELSRIVTDELHYRLGIKK